MLTGLLRLTVNNPLTGPVSLAWVVATMLASDKSSSAMVTVALFGAPIVAAELVHVRVTITVSGGSIIASSMTGTDIVAERVLAATTTVPVSAV